MGHIGLTPQTADKLGGFKVQGKDARTAKRLIEQAQALEKLGCFSANCFILSGRKVFSVSIYTTVAVESSFKVLTVNSNFNIRKCNIFNLFFSYFFFF